MKRKSFAWPHRLRSMISYTQLKQNSREMDRLRNENARYRTALDKAPIGHFTLDANFRIIETNRIGAERLNQSATELFQTSFLEKINSNERLRIASVITDVITSEAATVHTIKTSLRAQDKKIPVILYLSASNYTAGNECSCSIAVVDLSEYQATQNNLRIARDGLQHIAHHDPLTRLPNRCGLVEQLQQTLESSNQSTVALMLLDLDHFKQINDPLGHQIGDKLLREVSQRLLATVRKQDTVGRLGGDEFAVIMRDVKNEAEISRIADKISESLARPYSSTPHDIRLSASIGIGVFSSDTKTARNLLYYADAAMNQAKHRGRNCVQFYTPALNTSLTKRFELERDLRVAVRESQFELYYQPQYDLRTKSISGYEVLLRWNHPERGVVSPDMFIEVVEDTGLIEPLGEWILSNACKKLVEVRRGAQRDLKFSVNVSPRQFKQRDLQKRIVKIIKNTGIPAEAIELELTESALFENMNHSLDQLHELRAAGIDLAIDDFGTGYSSFSRLQQLPVSRVKIDRCFVHDIPTNQGNCSIVKAIISVAHDLGVEVVAEGVETHEQAIFLSQAGCDVLQGYYIGRPDTFQTLLHKTPLQMVEEDIAVA